MFSNHFLKKVKKLSCPSVKQFLLLTLVNYQLKFKKEKIEVIKDNLNYSVINDKRVLIHSTCDKG